MQTNNPVETEAIKCFVSGRKNAGRKTRVRSVRVESGNANKKYTKFHNGEINKHR